jgi:hypothetical protein
MARDSAEAFAMTLLATSSLDGFFQDALEDAMKARRIDASSGATTYLVGMLSEFAKPDPEREATLERPLVFLLDEALNTNDLAERFTKLRALGDGALYSGGFFLDHFERRGVDQSYLVGIGARAYEAAGSILVRGSQQESRGPHLFQELAQKFEAFVAVVSEVANLTFAKGAGGAKAILKLYERWLKTRSDTLADALAAHGFRTPRGNQVLQ